MGRCPHPANVDASTVSRGSSYAASSATVRPDPWSRPRLVVVQVRAGYVALAVGAAKMHIGVPDAPWHSSTRRTTSPAGGAFPHAEAGATIIAEVLRAWADSGQPVRRLGAQRTSAGGNRLRPGLRADGAVTRRGWCTSGAGCTDPPRGERRGIPSRRRSRWLHRPGEPVNHGIDFFDRSWRINPRPSYTARRARPRPTTLWD